MNDLAEIVDDLTGTLKHLRLLVSQTPDASGTRLREGVLRLEAAVYYMERALADAERTS